VSRAESPARILEAAIELGTTSGPSALTVQGVADAAGVSKALVLYHFAAKAALLGAILRLLGERGAARLRAAAGGHDLQEAWRTLALAEAASGELALLGALTLEPEVAPEAIARVMAEREREATAFVQRLFDSMGMTPRIPLAFVGRVLLRELDGLVGANARAARDEPEGSDLEAEQDAMLLTILALGR
jgi:AcrR family transcriptional regulator